MALNISLLIENTHEKVKIIENKFENVDFLLLVL